MTAIMMQLISCLLLKFIKKNTAGYIVIYVRFRQLNYYYEDNIFLSSTWTDMLKSYP
jgi:hypothetical protein